MHSLWRLERGRPSFTTKTIRGGAPPPASTGSFNQAPSPSGTYAEATGVFFWFPFALQNDLQHGVNVGCSCWYYCLLCVVGSKTTRQVHHIIPAPLPRQA